MVPQFRATAGALNDLHTPTWICFCQTTYDHIAIWHKTRLIHLGLNYTQYSMAETFKNFWQP